MNNKYGAKKEVVDGHRFDSRKEARRYVSLKMLVMSGDITDLKVHPKFVLLEGFIYRLRKIRAITYTADFMYQEKGETIVEDVKSSATKTQLFKVKWKMVKYKYPEFVFIVKED